MIATEYWKKYLLRDKSTIVDLFYGQTKNETSCPACHKVNSAIIKTQIDTMSEFCIKL